LPQGSGSPETIPERGQTGTQIEHQIDIMEQAAYIVDAPDGGTNRESVFFREIRKQWLKERTVHSKVEEGKTLERSTDAGRMNRQQDG
jgi:excinuclease UvrABC ATPase subunit